MAASTLEPYREEILSLLRKGQSKADVWRSLERKHGVRISRSQFYAFADQFTGAAPAESEEEPFMPVREAKDSGQIMADETVRLFLVELPRALEEMTQKLTELDQKAGERERAMQAALRQFHELLIGISKQRGAVSPRPVEEELTPEVSPPPDNVVSATTLRHIWKRAFIVSGVLWGTVELLLMQGYWRPLWAAVAQWL